MSQGDPKEPERYDIFVSYARGDVARVQLLAAALEAEGWKVFWDLDVPYGDEWESAIGVHLDSAPVVIPVWSVLSVKSKYVRDEVTRANKRQALIPVTIDDVEPMFGFGSINASDLREWLAVGGGTLSPRLRRSIERKISASALVSPIKQGLSISIPTVPPRHARDLTEETKDPLQVAAQQEQPAIVAPAIELSSDRFKEEEQTADAIELLHPPIKQSRANGLEPLEQNDAEARPVSTTEKEPKPIFPEMQRSSTLRYLIVLLSVLALPLAGASIYLFYELNATKEQLEATLKSLTYAKQGADLAVKFWNETKEELGKAKDELARAEAEKTARAKAEQEQADAARAAEQERARAAAEKEKADAAAAARSKAEASSRLWAAVRVKRERAGADGIMWLNVSLDDSYSGSFQLASVHYQLENGFDVVRPYPFSWWSKVTNETCGQHKPQLRVTAQLQNGSTVSAAGPFCEL